LTAYHFTLSYIIITYIINLINGIHFSLYSVTVGRLSGTVSTGNSETKADKAGQSLYGD